jgi:hypothetical protein
MAVTQPRVFEPEKVLQPFLFALAKLMATWLVSFGWTFEMRAESTCFTQPLRSSSSLPLVARGRKVV